MPFLAPATFDAKVTLSVSLVFLVISFGTAAILFFYGKVMLPITKFVVGTNVLKVIQAETRILDGATGGGIGKSFKSRTRIFTRWIITNPHHH